MRTLALVAAVTVAIGANAQPTTPTPDPVAAAAAPIVVGTPRTPADEPTASSSDPIVKSRTVDFGGTNAANAAPAAVTLNQTARDERAEARYVEMRRKIASAAEEILQLYGNPSFAEVVTNDPERAAELRQRISATVASDKLKAEVEELAKRREEISNDIALREREIERMKARAARLRATLDQTVIELQRVQRVMEVGAP